MGQTVMDLLCPQFLLFLLALVPSMSGTQKGNLAHHQKGKTTPLASGLYIYTDLHGPTAKLEVEREGNSWKLTVMVTGCNTLTASLKDSGNGGVKNEGGVTTTYLSCQDPQISKTEKFLTKELEKGLRLKMDEYGFFLGNLKISHTASPDRESVFYSLKKINLPWK